MMCFNRLLGSFTIFLSEDGNMKTYHIVCVYTELFAVKCTFKLPVCKCFLAVPLHSDVRAVFPHDAGDEIRHGAW